MNIHSFTSTLAASNFNVDAVVLTRLHEPSGLSIPDLVTSINEKGILTDCQIVQNAMRVRELRIRVEKGELGPNIKWLEYAAQTFGKKSTRLKELNQIAKAKDPFHELNRLKNLATEKAKRFKAKTDKNETLTEKQMRDAVKRFAKKGPIDQVETLVRRAEPMPFRAKVVLFAKEGPIDRVQALYELVKICRS